MLKNQSSLTPLILKIILRLFWFVLCGAVLWWFLNHPQAWENPEITVLYILIMLTITFPIGIVYWTILSMFAVVVPNPDLGKEVELGLIWIGFVAVGYIQWFVLGPWGYKKLKNIKSIGS